MALLWYHFLIERVGSGIIQTNICSGKQYLQEEEEKKNTWKPNKKD